MESVGRGGVVFRLDDGKTARLGDGDAQLRHIDRAFAATVHAFQGRTVDRILAAMPAGNPGLIHQRAFYVAISRARDRAELVTDDAHKLADQLERATGERLAAPDATAKQAAYETVFGRDADRDRERDPLTRAPDAMDRAHEAARDDGREHRMDREAGRDRATSTSGCSLPASLPANSASATTTKSAERRHSMPRGAGAAQRGPQDAGRGQGYLGKARNSSVPAPKIADSQNPGRFAV